MGLRWHEAEAAVGAWLMDQNMPIVGSFSGQKQLLSYTSFPRTGVKVCKNNASHSWIVTACCYCLECPAFSPCLSLGFNLQLLCFQAVVLQVNAHWVSFPLASWIMSRILLPSSPLFIVSLNFLCDRVTQQTPLFSYPSRLVWNA